MKRYFAVCGRHPKLSKAERSSLGATDIQEPQNGVITFQFPHDLPEAGVGGSLKRGSLIDAEDLAVLFEEVNLVAVADDHDGMTFKRTYNLKRYKYVPLNKTDKEIQEKGAELIRLDEHEEIWGLVEYYHDISWAETIEFEKPVSGMQVGMMPVKLVQMMMNMGVGVAQNQESGKMKQENGNQNSETSTSSRTKGGTNEDERSRKISTESQSLLHGAERSGVEMATKEDKLVIPESGGTKPCLESTNNEGGITDSLSVDSHLHGNDQFIKTGLTIYDPFCGFGTTGYVAHLGGHHFIGSDINPTPTKQNLSRRKLVYPESKDLFFTVFKHDVKQNFTQPYLRKVDAVVSEGRLGPAVNNQLTHTRKENERRDIIAQIDEVYISFITNRHSINPDATIIITYPQWTFWEEDMSFRFQRAGEKLGYTVENIGVYKRKGQYTARRVIRMGK